MCAGCVIVYTLTGEMKMPCLEMFASYTFTTPSLTSFYHFISRICIMIRAYTFCRIFVYAVCVLYAFRARTLATNTRRILFVSTRLLCLFERFLRAAQCGRRHRRLILPSDRVLGETLFFWHNQFIWNMFRQIAIRNDYLHI